MKKLKDVFESTLDLDESTLDLDEAKTESVTKEDLVPGFTFFVLSANGRSLSRYKITGEKEMGVGTVLEVKHTVMAGDKFKQAFIAKDFVLGTKGSLQVFKKQAQAMKAFKSNLTESIKAGSTFKPKKGEYPSYSVSKIVGDTVEYTIHTASGGKQQKADLPMFKRIVKNLK